MGSSHEAVFQSIDNDAIVALTQRMVRIPSVNPPGDYSAIASLMQDEFAAAGLETAVLEAQPGKPNVFAMLRGEPGAARTLLLSGHTDVVGPGDLADWRFDPFEAVIHDGAIWGRGTVNMKGAIAAQLFAVRAVSHTIGRPLPINVMLGATVDDEIAGPLGCKYVIEQGLESIGWPQPDLHVLGEANELNITGGFKGRLWSRITLRGKSAHGGAPAAGINAIEKMMLLHSRLSELARPRHPLHGSDTLNIGTIRGGARVNVVADSCTAEFDYRYGALTGEQAERGIRAILDSPDFDVTEVHVFERRDAIGISPGVPEVALLSGAIDAATGRQPAFLGTLSAGDAYYTLQRGIPGVWIGPGETAMLHVVNERLPIEQLLSASRVYASVILAFAGIPR
jgi:succinyl-diaminopimelate desuccinylase